MKKMETGFPSARATSWHAFWKRRHRQILLLATVLIVVVAAVWIGYQGWRLVFQPIPEGAIDLKLRFRETTRWFNSKPVYGVRPDAVYPPASYLLFKPFIDYGSLAVARWIWAVVTLISLFVLCRSFARESGAEGAIEKRFITLLPLALYPVGATIGNGQVGLLIAMCMLIAIPMLREERRSLSRDGLIALLMLLALIKPSLSAFFFLIVFFAPGGWRPATITVVLYTVATYLASLPQKPGPYRLLVEWKNRSKAGTIYGARFGEGAIIDPERVPHHLPPPAQERIAEQMERGVVIKSVNLHSLISYFGSPKWSMLGSTILLAFFAAWMFYRRKASVWTLAGVTGIVAIFSGYHAWYDHVILVFPLLILFRLARVERSTSSGVLFALLSLSLLAPGGVYAFPKDMVMWSNTYVVLQTVVFLAVLVHLVRQAGREHRAVQA